MEMHARALRNASGEIHIINKDTVANKTSLRFQEKVKQRLAGFAKRYRKRFVLLSKNKHGLDTF
jgi:hypothetical protein